jgi:hypothetical protein
MPNGQICYSAWKELQKPLEKRQTAQNVKAGLILLRVVVFTLIIIMIADTSKQ